MEKITHKTLIASVADRWRDQYKRHIGTGSDKDLIYNELLKLKPDSTVEEVTKIIGNDSWTALPYCDECDTKSSSLVVRVGEEPDCESNTAHLCCSCISKLSSLVRFSSLVGFRRVL